MESDNFDSYGSRYYGITQDPNTKDFIVIMDRYILVSDDLKYIADKLLYKSGNKDVDDFIANKKFIEINDDLIVGMMEFVPYDRFKGIKFIGDIKLSKIYKATWIDGPILNWNDKELNFERIGTKKIVLKQLKNSKNITSEKLNKVYINLIIIYNSITKNLT